MKVHGPEEARKLRCKISKGRILRSRFVYRDKNTSIRTPQRFVPVKAKARLAVGGQNCPDCAAGKIRTDAPTVQRTSVLVMLQIASNLGWLKSVRCGDVAAAFLKGDKREGEPLYFEPPRERGLQELQKEALWRS